MDRIVLEGMLFFGHHGISPEEQALGGRYQADLEVELSTKGAAASDELKDTVNYAQLYRVAKNVIEGHSRHLIEALAEELASQVLSAFPVQAVSVSLYKLNPPIRGGNVARAGVRITRRR